MESRGTGYDSRNYEFNRHLPKHHRQPREEIDFFLGKMGLYRRRIAMDGSSLFRVVAAQLFQLESYHPQIRAACVRYMRSHPETFTEGIQDFNQYLEQLKHPKTRGGLLEMKALSALYQCQFRIHHKSHCAPQLVQAEGMSAVSRKVHLAKVSADHFDSVESQADLSIAGVCQAAVYQLLYEDVFGMGPKAKAFVRLMMDERAPKPNNELDAETIRNVLEQYRRFGKPFPFKTAKSLEPYIYRNVAFDHWIEERKEDLHVESGRAYGPGIAVGSKCHVRLEAESTELKTAYIQKLSKDKGPVEVMVVDSGKKVSVPFDQIVPIRDQPPAAVPHTSVDSSPESIASRQRVPTSASSGSSNRSGQRYDQRPSFSRTRSRQYSSTSRSPDEFGSAVGSWDYSAVQDESFNDNQFDPMMTGSHIPIQQSGPFGPMAPFGFAPPQSVPSSISTPMPMQFPIPQPTFPVPGFPYGHGGVFPYPAAPMSAYQQMPGQFVPAPERGFPMGGTQFPQFTGPVDYSMERMVPFAAPQVVLNEFVDPQTGIRWGLMVPYQNGQYPVGVGAHGEAFGAPVPQMQAPVQSSEQHSVPQRNDSSG